MAEPVLLSDCKVYLGSVDLSTTVRSINMSAATAEQPNSRMGDTVEGMYPGLVQLNCSVGGFFGAGAGDSDPTIWGRFNSYAAGTPLTFCPPRAPAVTAGADGNTAYVACGPQLSYETWGNHGDLLPYTFKTAPETTKQGLHRAKIVYPKTTVSSAGGSTGTVYQLGAVGSGQSLLVFYHVFSVSGGTEVQIFVYSDDNSGMSSSTSRAGTTAVLSSAGSGSGVITVAGPITDDYWQILHSASGGTVARTLALCAVIV